MQQDLQYQNSGTAAAIAGAAPAQADESVSAEATAQAENSTWQADHAINLRLTVPFLRCYMTIVAGRERRNPDRRVDDRRKHPLATTWNLAFLGLLGLITGLALFTVIQFAARYVLEQAGAV